MEAQLQSMASILLRGLNSLEPNWRSLQIVPSLGPLVPILVNNMRVTRPDPSTPFFGHRVPSLESSVQSVGSRGCESKKLAAWKQRSILPATGLALIKPPTLLELQPPSSPTTNSGICFCGAAETKIREMEATAASASSFYMARSTPIEIPSVRRKIVRPPTPSTSIITAASPDNLVFHMSPDYPLSFRYPQNLMTERDRFMYSYPTIASAAASDIQSEYTSAACPSPSPDEVEVIQAPQSYRTRFLAHRPPYHHLTAPAIRATPVRKIIGFKPVLPSQSSTPVSQESASPAIKSYSGSPCRPSFPSSPPSSPWISSKGEPADNDVGPAPEVVVVGGHSALDFEKYLVNRIEKFTTKHGSFFRA
ncbi:hypothetical protein EYR40_009824 [Pleurotus pulmonarius]|nr:hypothetical protein EYR38_002868 [Pleurotus pulmonarius]KAF4591221.1 hypothetical protein EYR40_009824 [Pleurotus pulmonarius]